MTVDAQRMIARRRTAYSIAGTSPCGDRGRTASGQFAADGAATGTLAIAVAQSVPDGY